MVLFWGTIIWLVVWGIRQFTGDRPGDTGSRETPLEIAQGRLARGEISREEFEELKAERGRAIYGQWCQTCHGDAATGAGGDPLTPAHGPQGHTWHHPDGQLEAIIRGEFTYPGRTMPSFGSELTREEIEYILAYLKEGWTTEQREVQAETSRDWEQYQNSGQ
jgi:mono/diheme cytochrome c family protein